MRILTGLFSLIIIMLVCMSVFDGDVRKEHVEAKTITPFYNIYANSLTTRVLKNYEYNLELLDDGELVYSPGDGSGYRYGPSIMRHEDNSVDVWFASPGNGIEWDYIRYRHSNDGERFTNDRIVLTPSEGSEDHYSTCDPGAIYFNGYYYLAYTSTVTAKKGGVNNNLFVARSKDPDGPFEKWNGDGWSRYPEPIIRYDGNPDNWGIGEASFVIKDNELYIYYSQIDNSSLTMVAKSDLSENWPENIKIIDTAIVHENSQDSFDVVYVEDEDVFLAFAVESRFNEDSGICVYQSKDGIEFKKVQTLRENVHPYAHNMGIMKGEDGHIKLSDELILGYAYARGSSVYYWGRWNTMFHKAKINKIEK